MNRRRAWQALVTALVAARALTYAGPLLAAHLDPDLHVFVDPPGD